MTITELPPNRIPGAPTAAAPRPGPGARFSAAVDKAQVEADLWAYSSQIEAQLISEIRARLPDDAQMGPLQTPGIMQLPTASDYNEQVLAAARRVMTNDPEWEGVPVTREAFDAEVDRRRRATWDEASTMLGVSGPGAAGVAGNLAAHIFEPMNLATLPIGAGAGSSLARIMLIEGLANAAIEGASLPREYAVAEELDLPKPNPLARIATGFVGGAALSGALVGSGRVVSDMVAANRILNATGEAGANLTGAERFAVLTKIARDVRQQRRLAGTSPVELDARTETTAARMAAGEPIDVRVDFELEGKSRPEQPNPETIDMLRAAADATFGPGSRVVITSGKETPGNVAGAPRRHPGGFAADIRVYDAQGNLLTLDDPRALTFVQNARRFGATSVGAGKEYMGPAAFHIDMLPPDQYAPGQGPVWGSWASGNQAAILGVETGSGAAPRRQLTMQDFDFARGGNAGPDQNRIGYVFGRLLELGYEPHVAAALTGNVMQESGFTINTRAVGDGGNAFGMGQWNGPRRLAYLAFAERRGADPGDIDAQIAFLHHELQGPENAALRQIEGATTAADAARIASEAFWRPGIPHINNRVAYANAVWGQYTRGQVPRWTGASTASPAAGFTGYTTSRGYTGTGQTRVGDNTILDVEYQVVDIASLRPASGDLQPRDRSRAASDDWVAATAARLDPALLMPSPSADRGAPLIGPDDIIESGNGRVQALLRAYEQGLDRIDAYRTQIEAAGFDIPDGIKNPVLIARRKTDLSPEARRQMVIDAQDSGIARLTASERAEIGNRALTADAMSSFDPSRKLTDPANRDFARAFVNHFPKSERGAFTAADKGLSIDGVRQIQDSLFSRAWSAPDIVARAVEAEPGELKTILDALAAAAPDMAILRAEIAAGTVRADMDITPFVLEAVRLIVAAREMAAAGQGRAAAILDDLLADNDLLAGTWSPLTQALVARFMPNGRAAPADKIADFLTRYAREARQAGRTGDALGGAGPLDVLKAIDRDTFGKLDHVGQPREPLPDTATPDPVVDLDAVPARGFEDGAASPEAEAASALARAEIEGEPAAAVRATPVSAPERAADGGSDAGVPRQPDDPATALRAELEARGRDIDDMAFALEDGTTWSARDVLDDLDADRDLEGLIDLCNARSAA